MMVMKPTSNLRRVVNGQRYEGADAQLVGHESRPDVGINHILCC